MVETPARGGGDRRLGAEGDAEPGSGQHRDVVGAVADRDRLLRRYAVCRGECPERVPLAGTGDDRRHHLAGQPAAGHLQPVGDDMVEAQCARHPLGEDREPAGDEGCRRAGTAHGGDQGRCPRIQPNTRRHLVENAGLDPGQQGDAGLERGGEINLAVHCPAGDRGNPWAEAEDQRQLVEHLVFDDRRFEIGDEQPLAPLRRRLNQDIDRAVADDGARGGGERRGVRGVENEIAGFVRREPDRGGSDRQRRGDRGGVVLQAATASAGDQGEGNAHQGSSYAPRSTGDKRREADQAPAPAPNPAVAVIAGPTASGKSALALELAACFGATVINADALQCYRDLQILTARPDRVAVARSPHRLYGFLDAAERGSVGSWRGRAVAEIAAAARSRRLALVVGGTGLYIRALTHGLAPFPVVPEPVRVQAQALYRRLGGAVFRQRLAALDPAAAERLPAGDSQRLVRAYAVVRATGRPIGAWRERPHAPLACRLVTILLMPPRERLYAACDARFAAMIDAGALAEAAALMARGLGPDLPALKALGLPELILHLRGETSLADAVAAAQRATRHYAKRQTTWFRHQLTADLILGEQFSESLLRRSRQFIRDFLLTGPE